MQNLPQNEFNQIVETRDELERIAKIRRMKK